MLKDITLGQYFPGNTVAHKLDPRTKIILVIVYIVALFQANGWAGYAAVTGFTCLCTALSKIRPAAMFKGVKPMLFIIVLATVAGFFLIPYAMQRLQATTVSVYTNLQPVVASLVAFAVGQSRLLSVVSHTARRSALTNLYKTGMFDNREMMAISGHKSERVFEKYIKVGVSEQADRIYNKLKVLKGGKNKKVG